MIRNFLLTLFVLLSLSKANAQNGVQTINMPTGFTWPQIRAKNCMLATQDNFVYVGFRTIGLGIWNGTSWTMQNSTVWPVPSNEVRSLAFNNDTLWIGTTAGLVYSHGSVFGSFTTANSALLNDTINALFTAGGIVWAGTPSGLSRIAGSTVVNYTTASGSLTADPVSCLSGTPDGSFVWLGNSVGLSEFHNNTWTHYNASNSAIPAGGVTDMAFDGARLVFNVAVFPFLFSYQSGQPTPINSVQAILDQTPIVITSGNGNSFVSGAGGISYKFNGNVSEPLVLPYLPATLMSLAPSGQYLWYTKALAGATSDSSGAKLKRVDLNVFEVNPFDPVLTQLDIDLSNQQLDENNLRSLVRSNGEMFWNRSQGVPRCEFPKGSFKNISFANAFWMGGIDGGAQLHLAAQTYRQTGNDIWPGPLNPANGATDSATTAAFNTTWKITRNQIDEFRFEYQLGNVGSGIYQPHPSILNWPVSNPFAPAHGLAEFVDVNGDGVYNPVDHGDYPKIEGDQAIFWVMNDNFAAHTETGGTPLKIEVHAMAFSYACGNLPDSLKALNATNFFRYKIINRSINNYTSCVLGLWNDFDLGNYQDDIIGTDSLNNAVFVYNSDGSDGTGSGNSYGNIIPIASIQVLKGPAAAGADQIDNNNNGVVDEPNEDCLLSGSMFFKNDASLSGNPSTTNHFFNYLNQRWKDGSNLTFGGNGYQSGPQSSRFCFSGSPWDTTQWNAVGGADYRIIANVGKFTLDAGDTIEVTWALQASLDSSLAYGTQAYYEHAEADRASTFSWYHNSGVTPCSGVQNMLSISNAPELLCEGSELNLQLNSNVSLPANTQVIIQREGNSFSFFQPVIVDTVWMSGTQHSFVLPYSLLGNPDSVLTIRAFIAGSGTWSPAYNIPVVTLPDPAFSIANSNLTTAPATALFTNNTQNLSNYDFLWTFGDGSSMNDNNASLTHTYYMNGVFYVGLTLTDASTGCSITNYNPTNTSQSVNCNVSSNTNCGFTPIITPAGVINGCLGGNVLLSVDSNSYPAGATFQWNKNGVPLGGENYDEYHATANGYYSITVFDTSGCPVLSMPTQLNFNLPAAQTPTITQSGQSGNCGVVNVTLTANGNFANYLWNTGAVGNSITVTQAGVYTAVGQGAAGCEAASLPVSISSSPLATPEICMITVDSLTNHAIVVWEKDVSTAISGYGIYKETVFNSNNFQQIALVPYDSLSEFMDINSDAEVLAERYRISIVDTCGGETALSGVARPIGLKVFPGIGVQRYLSWNPYVGSNQNVSQYTIYSGPNYTQLTLLATVSSAISSYLDATPVNGINTVYRVYAGLSQSCESTRTIRTKSASNGSGNVFDPFVQLISKNSMEDGFDFNILPNPGNGLFTLLTYANASNSMVRIFDVIGNELYSGSLQGTNRVELNLSHLSSGVYFISLSDGKRVISKRLVVAK